MRLCSGCAQHCRFIWKYTTKLPAYERYLFHDLGLFIKHKLVPIDKQMSQIDKQAYLPDLWNSNCCDYLKQKMADGYLKTSSVYHGRVVLHQAFWLPSLKFTVLTLKFGCWTSFYVIFIDLKLIQILFMFLAGILEKGYEQRRIKQ